MVPSDDAEPDPERLMHDYLMADLRVAAHRLGFSLWPITVTRHDDGLRLSSLVRRLDRLPQHHDPRLEFTAATAQELMELLEVHLMFLQMSVSRWGPRRRDV